MRVCRVVMQVGPPAFRGMDRPERRDYKIAT